MAGGKALRSCCSQAGPGESVRKRGLPETLWVRFQTVAEVAVVVSSFEK